MRKRRLGKTGIELSELGYGCSGLFGKNLFGKPAITDEQAMSLIQMAIDSEITFFDTGFNYGCAEERLGNCITELIKQGHKRSDFVIETKCGETLDRRGRYGPLDFSPEWLKKSVEISLKRLKTDYIDLLATHSGNKEDFTDKFFYLMEDLKRQGIIRAYGVSGGADIETLNWIADNRTFDYVMLRYNIFCQDKEGLIQKLNDNGIGVLAGAAMGENLYSKRITKIRSLNDIWYLARALVHEYGNIKRGHDFNFINEYENITGNQIALGYVLDNENVSAALFNTISPEHLKENVKAAKRQLPEDIKSRIIVEGSK